MVTQTTMSNQQNDSSKDSGASSSREKKKRGLSLSSLKSPFKFLGKTYCKGCHKKCSGEVLRVGDLYFHNGCFNCKGCSTSLSQGYIDFTPYRQKLSLILRAQSAHGSKLWCVPPKTEFSGLNRQMRCTLGPK